MPIVRITLAAGRTSAQKKAAAVEITDSIVRHCGGHEEHVYVESVSLGTNLSIKAFRAIFKALT